MKRENWKWWLAGSVAWIILLAGWLAALADFTAVTSVIETRPASLLLLSMAALLFSFLLVRRRLRGTGGGFLIALAGIFFSAWLLFFSYGEREVEFRSDAITLHGTLYIPRFAPPEAGVVFIHGSGAETREFFRWHAKHFARHGMTALIYDKRGAGQSEGNTWTATYHDYARDAASAVRFLREVMNLSSEPVGLFGHSEGGWVAPVAYSLMDLQPAFLIVSSTTPMTPAQQVIYETGASVAGAGYDEDASERATSLQARVLEYQRNGRGKESLEKDLRQSSPEPWFDAAELPRRLYPLEEYDWWRSVMDFDVRPYWKSVNVPVLMISGGLDRNSDVKASQAEVRRLLREGGNEDFTGVIIPQMEHGMVEWHLPGGLPPPRFPAELPDLLIDWVEDR